MLDSIRGEGLFSRTSHPSRHGSRRTGLTGSAPRGKLPGRITVSPKERQRLLRFGAKLGKAINQLVTIVTPGTFLRWIREDKRAARKGIPIEKRGRRRTAEQIRRLVIKLAKENAWGYTRIVGELRKLRRYPKARSATSSRNTGSILAPGEVAARGTSSSAAMQPACGKPTSSVSGS